MAPKNITDQNHEQAGDLVCPLMHAVNHLKYLPFVWGFLFAVAHFLVPDYQPGRAGASHLGICPNYKLTGGRCKKDVTVIEKIAKTLCFPHLMRYKSRILDVKKVGL